MTHTNTLKLYCFLLAMLVTAVVARIYAQVTKRNPTSDLLYDVKPWYRHRNDNLPGREIILYPGQPFKGKVSVVVECEGKREVSYFNAEKALDSVSLLLPANPGVKKTQARIAILTSDNKYYKTIDIPARRHWTVYIYPHSHVDIGYTNLQEVVEKLHVRNIDVGIDLARKTQNYPEGARFIWNPEATWAVSSYLQKATPEQKMSFVEAVRKGWVQIDGAHSNINTSTCSDEELLRVFRNKAEIETLTGVPVTTMVQIDNPGGAWGLVQAAAQSGIKGFLSFPNYFDLRQRWENKPFYWLSQDGKSRIFFLQATSYGYGWRAKGRVYGLSKIQAYTSEYDRLSTNQPLANFIDPFIFEETEKLEKAGSPYDIYAMTWSMADNCLIDADLPEAVKLWNEKYAYPKLMISGSRGIQEAYEKKYKSIIPEYKGDFTEFWTQGLGSDARRVGMSRRGKENLIQAETLWPLLNRASSAPLATFNRSWENLLLASEHTWGYQNPAAPLAKEVEANKAAYFENAEKNSKDLILHALKPVKKDKGSGIAIINTLSWPRSGIITLSAAQSKAGNRVVNEQNKEMLSQRLSTGELVFQSEMVPPLGSKLYKVLSGKGHLPNTMLKGTNQLQNELISVLLDEKTGNIKSLVDLKTKREFVDSSSKYGMNSYNYLAGVLRGRPTDTLSEIAHAYNVSITVKENGPLVASLLINSKAESCNWLTREVRLIKNHPYLELINTLDKIATRQKEGIHYGFAFNVPSGDIRMDIPFGVMRPEKDQLSHSNKNWFAFQRWIDISNDDFGITWTAVETPIVEVGDITGIILDGARQNSVWLKEVAPTQTIFSWPINNHWETNFPLEQGGIISSRYMILPHNGSYDPVLANRFGVEQHRPLIAVEAEENPIKAALVSIDNPKVMISTLKASEDNKAIILRLRSVSGSAEKVKLSWPAGGPKSIFNCKPDEQPLKESTGDTTLPPYGTSSFRISF